MVRPVTVMLAGLCLLAAGCGGSGDDKASSSGAEPPPAQPSCAKVSSPPPHDVGKLAKPTKALDPAKTYVAAVSTSCGDFQITLDAKRAPKTGGSFKYLADQKFFDG